MKIAVSGDGWLGQHVGYQGQQPRKGRHARDASQGDHVRRPPRTG